MPGNLKTGRIVAPKGLVSLGVVGIVGIFYYLFNPLENSWMPQCVFHKLTGLQCMGCGAQRMAHSLLHGDFRGAFQANALLLCFLPFLGFLVWVEFNRVSHPLIYRRVHSRWVIIAVSAILTAWLILRNIWEI